MSSSRAKKTFSWVLACSSIPGNEADQVAKSAAIEGYKPFFKVPYTS